jgi:hypothetical protein
MAVLAESDGSSPVTITVSRYDRDPAPRRMSVHTTAAGRVFQQFPHDDLDRALKIELGLVDSATRAALVARYETLGATWRWTDDFGDSFLVLFAADGLKSTRWGPDEWECVLTFDVVEFL